MTIEQVLRNALDKTAGDEESAMTLLKAWYQGDGDVRALIQDFGWELIKGYLADIKEVATPVD